MTDTIAHMCLMGCTWNCREAARARKAEEVRQQRLHRAQLLKGQLAAMTAQQARQQAAAAMHVRYCTGLMHVQLTDMPAQQTTSCSTNACQIMLTLCQGNGPSWLT